MRKLLPHLTCAIGIAMVYVFGGLGLLEDELADLRFRLLQRPASGEIVVVAIDAESLRDLRTWPWPRQYHASLVDNLVDAGARRIALDLDFSSPSTLPRGDEGLLRSLRRAGGRVILPSFVQWLDRGGRKTLTEPLEPFQEHASPATIDVRPEPGSGLVRRYGDDLRPTGAGAPLLAEVLAARDGEPAGSFHIDFGIDPRTIPRISYRHVLDGRFDRDQIRGKSVIVGATAPELGDRIAVPIHAAVPGPVLQALAYESLVQGRALRRLPAGLLVGLTLLLAWVVGPRIEKASWQGGLTIVGGAAVGLLALSVAVQSAASRLVDVSPILLALLGSYAIGRVRAVDGQNLVGLLFPSLKMQDTGRMMHHVVDYSTEAILTVDEEGLIQTLNPAAERMFACAAATAIGEPIADRVQGGLPDPRDLLRAPGARVETLARRPDGGTFVAELASTAFPFEGGVRRVAFLRDITYRKAQEAALQHQATHDALTDLPNRVMLQARVAHALRASREACEPMAFLVLDLDRFKDINDTLGHYVGDLLLREIAKRLRRPLRGSDTIARLGGDEFAILLTDTDADQARAVATRLVDALREPFQLNGLSLQVETSVGIAMFPEHGRDSETLLQRADVAMYVAKKGRTLVAFYSAEEDFHSVRHLTLQGELHRAVEEDDLVLFFQPKISSTTERLAGVEALVRWQHPEHGLVQPHEFIPLAEHTGLIKPITKWVLQSALRHCAAWDALGARLSVSVNCSARNLLEEDLPVLIDELLDRHKLSPDRLVLEITETVILGDPERALEVTTELANRGIRISIDDFGTGYSSLDYLRKMPAHELKIDRSFVIGMEHDAGDEVIVRAVVDLAHNLGLQASAEGVEKESIWTRLREMGCDHGQGYFFGWPLAGPDFEEWMRRSPFGPFPVPGVPLGDPSDDADEPADRLDARVYQD